MSNMIPFDSLSPAAAHVLRINQADAYHRLVVHNGDGPVEARDVLETLKPGEVLRGSIVADHNAAACVIAGLWLWHDFLDPAHTIVQAIETPTGSLWHAVLHRREGDFSNAKYWYARAGKHAALTSLASRAIDLTQGLPADKTLLKLSANGWNASAFVDLCEAVHAEPGDPRHATAVAIQRAEWESLFAATIREAQHGG